MDPQPQKSMVIPIALSVLLSALVFGGGAYYLGTIQTPTETPVVTTQTTPQSTATVTTSTTTSPTTTTTSTTNTYDLTKVKVGDKVADMTVSAVAPYSKTNGRSYSVENAKVSFSGQATVAGKYTYHADGILQGEVCLDVDQDSVSKLPKALQDERATWFCFSNAATAREALGPAGTTGKATVIIDKYVDVNFPSEVVNSAELIKVANFTPGAE